MIKICKKCKEQFTIYFGEKVNKICLGCKKEESDMSGVVVLEKDSDELNSCYIAFKCPEPRCYEKTGYRKLYKLETALEANAPVCIMCLSRMKVDSLEYDHR